MRIAYLNAEASNFGLKNENENSVKKQNLFCQNHTISSFRRLVW